MKTLPKHLLVSAVSAVLGGLVVLGVLMASPDTLARIKGENDQKVDSLFDHILKQQNRMHEDIDKLFGDDFFKTTDPFSEMKKIRDQIEGRMEKPNTPGQSFVNPFDSWFSRKFGGGNVQDVSMREDENFVYYDIVVDNLNGTSVEAHVQNGHVIITGTTEKKNSSDGENGFQTESVFKSSFNRTFPLPENVDSTKMQMKPDNNKVVLKFPKVEGQKI